jgi:hypothetical protein
MDENGIKGSRIMMSTEDKEIIAGIVRKELIGMITDLTILKYDVDQIAKKLDALTKPKADPGADINFDQGGPPPGL